MLLVFKLNIENHFLFLASRVILLVLILTKQVILLRDLVVRRAILRLTPILTALVSGAFGGLLQLLVLIPLIDLDVSGTVEGRFLHFAILRIKREGSITFAVI